MIRWMCNNTRREKAKNDNRHNPHRREDAKNPLQWFGYVRLKPTDTPV